MSGLFILSVDAAQRAPSATPTEPQAGNHQNLLMDRAIVVIVLISIFLLFRQNQFVEDNTRDAVKG